MPSAAQNPQLMPVFAEVMPGLSGMNGQHAPEVGATASPATGAVENALQVTDLQAAASQGAQSAVNLKFNVAGENLSVRVALQGGQVHTQFRTDSGELRTALAHEWQSVSSGSGASRLAEPVFTAQSKSDARQQADFGGGGGRQPGQQGNAPESDADYLGISPAAAQEQQAAASRPELDLAPAGAALSSRLNSFA
jgi:hypothetical protein